jgi:hypothetical protein
MNLQNFKFNCAPESGIDWKNYDGIEISGCVDVSFDHEETCFEAIDKGTPEIITVYLHCEWGGVECLHDFGLNEHDKAIELSNALLAAHPQLKEFGINDCTNLLTFPSLTKPDPKTWQVVTGDDEVIADNLTQFEAERCLCRQLNLEVDAYLRDTAEE